MGFGVTLNGGTGKEVILGVGVRCSIRAQLAGSRCSERAALQAAWVQFPGGPPPRRRARAQPPDVEAEPPDVEAGPPLAQPEGRK